MDDPASSHPVDDAVRLTEQFFSLLDSCSLVNGFDSLFEQALIATVVGPPFLRLANPLLCRAMVWHGDAYRNTVKPRKITNSQPSTATY